MGMTYFAGASTLNTLKNLSDANNSMGDSLSKLSSGLRVPAARFDVAASAIGTKIKSQVSMLRQALMNTTQGSTMLDTADGGLSEQSKNLTRMCTLSVQAKSAQNSDEDIAKLDLEFQSLKAEVDRISKSVEFNGRKLLAGTNTATEIGAGISNAGLSKTGISVSFSTAYDDGGPILVTYDHSAKTMTVTERTSLKTSGATDKTQTITVTDSGAQTLNFDTLGVTVNLASNFSRAASMSTATGGDLINTAGASITVAGTTAGSIVVTTTATGNTNNKITATSGRLNGITDGVVKVSSTNVTTNGLTFTLEAAGGNFTGTLASGSVATGTKSIALSRTISDGTTESITFEAAITYTAASGGTPSVTSSTFLTLNELAGMATNYKASSELDFQVGTTSEDFDVISLTIGATGSTVLGIESASLITDSDTALNASSAALSTIQTTRSNVAAIQNRLKAAASDLSVSSSNLDTAYGELVNLDIPEEMTTFIGKQLLVQTGVSMLSKINESKQQITQLLR